MGGRNCAGRQLKGETIMLDTDLTKLAEDTRDVVTLAKLLGTHESRLLQAARAGKLQTLGDVDRIPVLREDGRNYFIERNDYRTLRVARSDLARFLAAHGTPAERASDGAAWAKA
jgi:hypothetical protein